MFEIHAISNIDHPARRAGFYWGVFDYRGNMVAAFDLYMHARHFIESLNF